MKRCSVLLSLLLLGCFSSKDNALFEREHVTTTGGTSAATQAGTGSGPSGGGFGTADLSGGSGSTGTTAGASVGGTGAGGPSTGDAATGTGGQTPAPTPLGCADIEGAVTGEHNGHCYRLSLELLTFSAATEACRAAGGHLVTISDAVENTFVSQLHEDEHWIGATDGRGDRAPGAGAYFWVNQEPWSYDGWEDGQPNAHNTDCPDESGGAHCYEHCGYQAKGGGWIDRSCWHTIASICEWEPGTDTPPGQSQAAL